MFLSKKNDFYWKKQIFALLQGFSYFDDFYAIDRDNLKNLYTVEIALSSSIEPYIIQLKKKPARFLNCVHLTYNLESKLQRNSLAYW